MEYGSGSDWVAGRGSGHKNIMRTGVLFVKTEDSCDVRTGPYKVGYG